MGRLIRRDTRPAHYTRTSGTSQQQALGALARLCMTPRGLPNQEILASRGFTHPRWSMHARICSATVSPSLWVLWATISFEVFSSISVPAEPGPPCDFGEDVIGNIWVLLGRQTPNQQPPLRG